MVIVALVTPKGLKRSLGEVHAGVKFVAVTLHVFKSTTCTYVDSVLEKLQIRWDLKN
tara:strand:- start:175 stop:345 length:171 start_codon:yes stop_codon:yes gene_type:complete